MATEKWLPRAALVLLGTILVLVFLSIVVGLLGMNFAS